MELGESVKALIAQMDALQERLRSFNEPVSCEELSELLRAADQLKASTRRTIPGIFKRELGPNKGDPNFYELSYFYWQGELGGESQALQAAEMALILTVQNGGYLKRAITNFITAGLVAKKHEEMHVRLSWLRKELKRQGESEAKIDDLLGDRRLTDHGA